jgi:NADPH:quinone reductase-like Zn-dependent oxidoreductase
VAAGQTLERGDPGRGRGGRAVLVILKELIEAGKITPIVDRRFPLDEVPEAIRYLESGQAIGKLFMTV